MPLRPADYERFELFQSGGEKGRGSIRPQWYIDRHGVFICLGATWCPVIGTLPTEKSYSDSIKHRTARLCRASIGM